MKVKLSLGVDTSLGYGHLLNHCGKRQAVYTNELEDRDTWNCAYCNVPLIVKIGDNMYEIGKNITI